jgi:putative transcriptional regulator
MTWRPGDPPPPSDTDWAALDALSDAEVEARALADPDAPPLTDEQLARLRRVPSVRLLRRRLGMTQAAFAAAFALPLGTLRDWEQGRKRPDAPARALLRVIEREPEAAKRALEPTG